MLFGDKLLYCDGKSRFDTFTHAKTAANRARKNKGYKVHSYKCPACGGFHNGGLDRSYKHKRAKILPEES